MPGEAPGIPGTATPRTAGFSRSRRRMSSAGTYSLETCGAEVPWGLPESIRSNHEPEQRILDFKFCEELNERFGADYEHRALACIGGIQAAAIILRRRSAGTRQNLLAETQERNVDDVRVFKGSIRERNTARIKVRHFQIRRRHDHAEVEPDCRSFSER